MTNFASVPDTNNTETPLLSVAEVVEEEAITAPTTAVVETIAEEVDTTTRQYSVQGNRTTDHAKCFERQMDELTNTHSYTTGAQMLMAQNLSHFHVLDNMHRANRSMVGIMTMQMSAKQGIQEFENAA